MVNIRDVDTEINIYPIEKIEGMQDTAYDVWLKMYIELTTKGLKFNAEWGCHLFDLRELYENLIKMEKNPSPSSYSFAPEEKMISFDFRKNDIGSYYVRYTLYTDIRSDIYVNGISHIDIPTMENLIIGVKNLIDY
ncbi:hypothetical protein ACFFL1_07560 [Samsonia erythrinae]|uniref:Immunity protein 42 of polymorphic toxin system n=1 Tax=Samsonia erythrinae TaxID=160434 RepID=A0A4R3VSK4_9GAMM|nr:hypothetical protein [Samsonia erythrinae]TCV07813.1 hypothetical protein EDC54_102385 [Samsonia erythrinae]